MAFGICSQWNTINIKLPLHAFCLLNDFWNIQNNAKVFSRKLMTGQAKEYPISKSQSLPYLVCLNSLRSSTDRVW
jgi:hypothetical protein